MNLQAPRDISLQDLLEWGDIAVYEYRGSVLPDILAKNTKAKVRLFFDSRRKHNLSGIRENSASVFFLDHQATKAFFAGFPGCSRYVLVRLIPRLSWFFMLPGLVRRLLLGQVKIQGVVRLKAGTSYQRWLIIKHKWARSLNSYSFLSSELGVQGFLDYLRQKEVHYVVLRFFDALPDLHREGADLDILLANEDRDSVDEFLQKHPGPIRVELKTVSHLRNNNLPYFPPHLARAILDSSIDGPAGSRIPAPKEAFLSLAYHALYHKGVNAGISSRLPSISVNEFPESNYTEKLNQMAEKLGVNINITMEDIDEYLHQNGWRPKIDTLAKIALENKWVQERFFREKKNDIGLGVFVLKERAFESNLADSIIDNISKRKGFIVIRKKIFSEENKKLVADHLRGGVWADEFGSTDGLFPAMALVILDLHRARASVANAIPRRMGIRKLKEDLRAQFDSDNASIVHSTDNTEEAWEYIQTCFPEDAEKIREEIESLYKNIRLSPIEYVVLRIRMIPHILKVWAGYLRAFVIRHSI